MTDSTKDDELAGTEQPFVQHLVELRDRLVKAMIGIAVAAVLLSIFPGPAALYDLLAAPLVAHLPKGATLIATSVISPFMVPLKVLMMAAFLLALPVVLWQVWAFVAPGLYSHEKKLVLPLVVSSTLLFFVGVAFCYFFVFGQAFPAIQKMAPTSVSVSPDIEAYLDFVITMFIAFGVAFEVPIVVVILARMKVVTVAQLKAFRSYFIVAAAAVSGLVTRSATGTWTFHDCFICGRPNSGGVGGSCCRKRAIRSTSFSVSSPEVPQFGMPAGVP